MITFCNTSGAVVGYGMPYSVVDECDGSVTSGIRYVSSTNSFLGTSLPSGWSPCGGGCGERISTPMCWTVGSTVTQIEVIKTFAGGTVTAAAYRLDGTLITPFPPLSQLSICDPGSVVDLFVEGPAGDVAMATKVTGEPFNSFEVLFDGTVLRGNGQNAPTADLDPMRLFVPSNRLDTMWMGDTTSVDLPLVSGKTHYTYFYADEDASLTGVESYIGTTIGAGLTAAYVALHTVASNGDLTRIAVSANTPNHFMAAGGASTFSMLSALNFVSPGTVRKGQALALGVLCVGTTMPRFAGHLYAPNARFDVLPRWCAEHQTAGQTTIPTTVATASLGGGTSAVPLWFRLVKA